MRDHNALIRNAEKLASIQRRALSSGSAAATTDLNTAICRNDIFQTQTS